MTPASGFPSAGWRCSRRRTRLGYRPMLAVFSMVSSSCSGLSGSPRSTFHVTKVRTRRLPLVGRVDGGLQGGGAGVPGEVVQRSAGQHQAAGGNARRRPRRRCPRCRLRPRRRARRRRAGSRRAAISAATSSSGSISFIYALGNTSCRASAVSARVGPAQRVDGDAEALAAGQRGGLDRGAPDRGERRTDRPPLAGSPGPRRPRSPSRRRRPRASAPRCGPWNRPLRRRPAPARRPAPGGPAPRRRQRRRPRPSGRTAWTNWWAAGGRSGRPGRCSGSGRARGSRDLKTRLVTADATPWASTPCRAARRVLPGTSAITGGDAEPELALVGGRGEPPEEVVMAPAGQPGDGADQFPVQLLQPARGVSQHASHFPTLLRGAAGQRQ